MKGSQGCSISTINSSRRKKSKIGNIVKPSLVALAVAQTMSMSSAQAATIYVGGTNGAGCGLIEAILNANNDRASATSNCVAGSGDDVIELNRDVTLTKARQDIDFGLPLITSNITINGNGHTISRDPTAPDFGLVSAYFTELKLKDLSLTNAKGINNFGGGADAAAIYAEETNLSLEGVNISNNTTEAAVSLEFSSLSMNDTVISNNVNGILGARVFNINIIDSSISNNEQRGIDFYYVDEVNITNSSISNNEQGGIDIYYPRDVNISDSHINNNGDRGILIRTGIFGESGAVTVKNTSISGNLGTPIALGSVEKLELSSSTISGNLSAGCSGLAVGGIAGYGTAIPIVIDNTTISNNTSSGSGGAICMFSTDGYDISNTRDSFVVFQSLEISNSRLTDNFAARNGGAIFSAGITNYGISVKVPHTIINTTISGNTAGGSGGAIFLDGYNPYPGLGSRELVLINSTIVDNSAGVGGGIAAGSDSYGNVVAGSSGISYLKLFNSIIAGNSATVSGSEINQVSALTYPNDDLAESNNNVLGSSLESNFQAFNGFTPSVTDITATIDGNNPAMLDEIVADLQDNGGATQTHALPAGSPAIDAGDLDTCINDPVNALDQRGEVRGELGLCDIGAYETQGATGDLPTISIDSVEVSEGDTKARLTISLSSPQTERIPVDFQTVDGTATEGLDYTGRFGTMTFAPGQTQKVRVIQLNDDDLGEQTESFSLMLSNPVGATLDEAVGEVTILDDDGLPTISIEPADHSVNEGDLGNNRRVSYTIKLSTAQTEKVSVDYQTIDESAVGDVDYEIRSGRMTFMPGQTSKIRTVKVLGDTQVEADETFKLIFSNPSANAVLDIDEADTIGTILDDD